jgi:hypothetical protein
MNFLTMEGIQKNLSDIMKNPRRIPPPGLCEIAIGNSQEMPLESTAAGSFPYTLWLFPRQQWSLGDRPAMGEMGTHRPHRKLNNQP